MFSRTQFGNTYAIQFGTYNKLFWMYVYMRLGILNVNIILRGDRGGGGWVHMGISFCTQNG